MIEGVSRSGAFTTDIVQGVVKEELAVKKGQWCCTMSRFDIVVSCSRSLCFRIVWAAVVNFVANHRWLV